MSEQQVFSYFDYFPSMVTAPEIKSKIVVVVPKERSSARYVYDCGEELLGAKKHLSKMMKFSPEWLDEIEKNPSEAYASVSKNELLGDFSPESLRNSGFSSEAAYAVKLILRRVSPRPEDTKENRKDYIKAIIDLQERLNKCVNQELFETTIQDLKAEVMKGKHALYPEFLRRDPSLKEYSYWISLGKKFISLFVSSSRKTYPGYSKLQSQAFKTEEGKEWRWADTNQEGEGQRQRSKERWERIVPTEVIRLSQEPSGVSKPEHLIEQYGFRGVQFGNWVEDSAGMYHVLCSGNAWNDLASILSLPRKAISFYERLGLAFGSRGSGSAVAHYEPVNNVMNLTKIRGGGAQCHEWAHALDFNLFSLSHKFNNGRKLALSGNTAGSYLPQSVINSFNELMKMLKKGEGGERYFIPDPLPTESGRYRKKVVSVLELHNFNVNNALISVKNQFACSAKQLADIGIMYCNILSQRIEAVPDHILIPTDYSSFYLDARERGAYWKRDHELFARAFEAWIEDEITNHELTNSYLVYGTCFSGPYPHGEERKTINEAFKYWWRSVSSSGILHDEKLWN